MSLRLTPTRSGPAGRTRAVAAWCTAVLLAWAPALPPRT